MLGKNEIIEKLSRVKSQFLIRDTTILQEIHKVNQYEDSI
jgi:hypothetical protein